MDKIIATLGKACEWVEEIRYSPGGDHLAYGSHDNFIYIYDCAQDGKYTRPRKCKGHSSYITAIDWTAEGDMIRTVCGAYELLFFNADTGK